MIDPVSTPSGSSHMEVFCFNSPRQRDLSCSNSPHGPQHFFSKRRRVEDIDSIILKSLLESLEKRDLKDKTKEMGKTNPDLYDGLEIAETLSKFISRQRAMAKVNIHQMLFKIEFPKENLPLISPNPRSHSSSSNSPLFHN